MNLNKAIELLQLDLNSPGSIPIEDLNAAQELGIEALLKIDKIRSCHPLFANLILPGETKD